MPPPLLLPGQSLECYQLLRQAIFAKLASRSAIEWLLAIDVVELSWEIQRYRLLRQKVLQCYRERALEQSLRQIDLAGIPAEFEAEASYQTRRNAQSWRLDLVAASEIEARLAAYGFDQQTLNLEIYSQARDIFLMFEALLNTAQSRRIYLLREIVSQRCTRNTKRAPPGIKN
jgi:hypothetical protein